MSLPAGLGGIDPQWAVGYAYFMLETGNVEDAWVAITLARAVLTHPLRHLDEETDR